jgi:hypothetical protein
MDPLIRMYSSYYRTKFDGNADAQPDEDQGDALFLDSEE